MRSYFSFLFISSKKSIALFALMAFLFTTETSFGQYFTHYDSLKFDRDKQTHITLSEFYNRVDKATKLLETKSLSNISDKDHINIIMCLNTIAFCKHTIKGVDKRFLNTKCKKFESVADKKKYSDSIRKIYPEIPSRGLGQYFPKLKTELYGTPYLYAIYSVS